MYKFSDDRELRGDTYTVGGCEQYSHFPTGSQFNGNYTLAGRSAPIGSTKCLVQNNEYSSFQATVLRANGFAFEAKEIHLDDIDSLTRVAPRDSWMDSMAIFGKRGSEYILPTTTLAPITDLLAKKYTVTKEAMKAMGFNDGKLTVPGGEFSPDNENLHNCAFGSTKCRITAKFSSPIDTMVILYASAQNSKYDPNAAVFFSEVTMKCGCRCSDTTGVESKSFTPVAGSTTECTMTTDTRPSLKCDMLGDKVCYHDAYDTWVGVGGKGKLPNGNYECVKQTGTITKLSSSFSPKGDFKNRPGQAKIHMSNEDAADHRH